MELIRRRRCHCLFPSHIPLSHAAVHLIFHRHDVLDPDRPEERQMHDALRPDRGVDGKNNKCKQYDAVDHRPRGRIGGNIAHHEDISRDADERKNGKWHRAPVPDTAPL